MKHKNEILRYRLSSVTSSIVLNHSCSKSCCAIQMKKPNNSHHQKECCHHHPFDVHAYLNFEWSVSWRTFIMFVVNILFSFLYRINRFCFNTFCSNILLRVRKNWPGTFSIAFMSFSLYTSLSFIAYERWLFCFMFDVDVGRFECFVTLHKAKIEFSQPFKWQNWRQSPNQ